MQRTDRESVNRRRGRLEQAETLGAPSPRGRDLYVQTVHVNAARSEAPYAKIGRATQRGLELQSRIIGWSSGKDLQPVAMIAADRVSWELRLPNFDPPPLTEWALILGDAIHNLRSALDVFVWSQIDESAMTARQKRSVSFPIWSDAEDWDQHAPRLLMSVPAGVSERIRSCQPFQRPNAERHGDPLLLLAELDNQDKHRLMITPTVQLEEMQASQSITFVDQEAAARNLPPDVTLHGTSLVPGSLLLSGTAKDPIERIGGSGSMQVLFGVEVDGGLVGVLELLERLVNYATEVINHVSG